MRYKLGKREATHDRRDFLFKDFLPKALPAYPKEFGHEQSVGVWNMYKNDVVGDCAIAGAAHEHMLWTTLGMNPIPFDDAGVLADYSAISGYDGTPDSDTGCDMHDVMNYRLNTGLVDAAGNKHKVAAFLFLDPGNVDHLLLAGWMFALVGLGIQFPDSAMTAFDNGDPWDVQRGAEIVGGHYIPGVAYRGGLITVVTWGKLQQMTPAFFSRYCDEAIVMVTQEQIDGTGRTPEGFDYLALREALNAL